ncbi:hypothetical protein [Paenibacillus sp. MBLB4367]|uniref:hypothetical protein n=1 Tax=Paenibacillus sp. MBLB4367 TaxID=3384767 RepID=UPI003908416A
MSNSKTKWSYGMLAAVLAGTVTIAGCGKENGAGSASPSPSGGTAAPSAAKAAEPYELK